MGLKISTSCDHDRMVVIACQTIKLPHHDRIEPPPFGGSTQPDRPSGAGRTPRGRSGCKGEQPPTIGGESPMFNITPSEILTIVVVALIVFGPRRLVEISRRAGQITAQLRRTADDVRRAKVQAIFR